MINKINPSVRIIWKFCFTLVVFTTQSIFTSPPQLLIQRMRERGLKALLYIRVINLVVHILNYSL